MYQGGQAQIVVPPFTKAVKAFMILHGVIWFLLVVVLQGMFMDGPHIFTNLGLVPGKVIHDFFVWQPFTYMFLHSESVFHVVFNMLILWMFGSELEGKWGDRLFALYYLACGIGAGILYTIVVTIYGFASGDFLILSTPVVGASGAVFGLILAYGILFGERVVHFMMIFPMKAKYFAMILGAVEFMTVMTSGLGGRVANLAHLGGLVSGFIFLRLWAHWKSDGRKGPPKRKNRNLRLVVDNEKEPKYWN